MSKLNPVRLVTQNGVSPSYLVLPKGNWLTLFDFLVAYFVHISKDEWAARIAAHQVCDDQGIPITLTTVYQAGIRISYYRHLAPEPKIPFEARILFQDDYLVVVDKPHFLPVIPSGRYLQETLLVRLKNQLHIETLAPIHRLDKDTAGLVLFSIQANTRGAYQNLFQTHSIFKSYEAIGAFNPDLNFPLCYQSRIMRAEPFFLSQEVVGIPNARTQIEVLDVKDHFARYRLLPDTGKKHQLRLHMAALGIGILNDPFYPHLRQDQTPDLYVNPLQLLAKTLEFKDPITGNRRYFESQQYLCF